MKRHAEAAVCAFKAQSDFILIIFFVAATLWPRHITVSVTEREGRAPMFGGEGGISDR